MLNNILIFGINSWTFSTSPWMIGLLGLRMFSSPDGRRLLNFVKGLFERDPRGE